MSSPQSTLKFLWHTRGLALTDMAGLLVAGSIGTTPGMQTVTKTGRGSTFTLPFIASLLPNIVRAHQGSTWR